MLILPVSHNPNLMYGFKIYGELRPDDDPDDESRSPHTPEGMSWYCSCIWVGYPHNNPAFRGKWLVWWDREVRGEAREAVETEEEAIELMIRRAVEIRMGAV